MYLAKQNEGYVMVIDGKAGPDFDKIGPVAGFSADGKHAAYSG